jgi:TolB protein
LAIGRGSRRRFVGRELVAVALVSLVLVGGSAGRGESVPDVEILSIDLGGRQTNLTKNPALDTSPAIAPDGRIAFVSTRDGSPDLYVMDGDGSDVRRLTRSPINVTGRAEDADAVSCCDSGETQLSWSPSGRRLAFDAANSYVPRSCFTNCVTWDAYVIRDDGTDLRLVAPGGRSPSWSPDGRSLAYLSGVDPFGVATELTIRRFDGSRVRSLAVDNIMSEVGPTWSPSGDEIAFHGRGGKTKPLMVGVARADGTRQRWLKEGRRPAWSPSGRRIAYVGRADGLDFRLLTVSSSGGPKRRLSHPALDVWAAAWSPRGRELAFVAQHRRGGPLAVMTMTPGGRPSWGRVLTQLPAGTRLWAGPRWSPDGRRIVVAVQLP